MGTGGSDGRSRGSETEESQGGIRSQKGQCDEETEATGSLGVVWDAPGDLGGLARAGIDNMGFRIRTGFNF